MFYNFRFPSFINHENSTAVGGGLRMPKCPDGADQPFLKTPLFADYIPSFCKTISSDPHVQYYRFYFFFVYDSVDPCLSKVFSRQKLEELFEEKMTQHCPAGIVQGLELHPCNYSHSPAWSQNDAMMIAYWRNVSYFYR